MDPPAPSGRARGRARGRPPPQPQAPAGAPAPSPAEPSPGPSAESAGYAGAHSAVTGTEFGGAIRGRGGFSKSKGVLVTIPPMVKITAGEGGTIIKLLANYFTIETSIKMLVQTYHVTFDPPVEATKIRKALLYSHKDQFGQAYIFDGSADLKCVKRFDQDPLVLTATRKSDDATIEIKIKRTGEISWGHNEMMRLYNTQMMRNFFTLGFMRMGRNFFDQSSKVDIPSHKLQIWPGFVTAINEHDAGIMMVVDTCSKIIRSDTAYEMLQKILQQDRQNFKDNARRQMAGLVVLTCYNNKTYKIDDVVFDKNPSYEFETRQGATNLVQYYRSQYNVEIKDDRQPLLLVKPTARQMRGGVQGPIYLVPELCAMTGLSDNMVRDFELKQKMDKVTRMTPSARVHHLQEFMKKIQANEKIQQEMSSWGLSFSPEILELPGRVFPGEKIWMRNEDENSGTNFEVTNGTFDREIRGKSLRKPVEINNWVIICTKKDHELVDEYCQALRRVCGPLGITLTQPRVLPVDNDRTGSYIEILKKIPEKIRLVNIFVPNNNKERYDSIKKVLCIDQPKASQVIVGRTLTRKNQMMSVCTKVGIQMAVKLGAEAWAVHIPPKNLMICGYDTYHDSSRRGASVGGFVCSMNSTHTAWYSRVAYHQNPNEMSDNFAINFTAGLKRYQEKNGRLPNAIVIYRDGVSEGQIPYVFDYELKQIREAIANANAPEEMRLCFVIVTKRINTRYFTHIRRTKIENPPPGTIIDVMITRTDRYDFFLVSQTSRQGTVTPTHYNIIEDRTNWRPQHHQQLAYKMCHLYFNWPGIISLPAPCQYAHKLAYLTGTSLHREPDVNLSDTLFYL